MPRSRKLFTPPLSVATTVAELVLRIEFVIAFDAARIRESIRP